MSGWALTCPCGSYHADPPSPSASALQPGWVAASPPTIAVLLFGTNVLSPLEAINAAVKVPRPMSIDGFCMVEETLSLVLARPNIRPTQPLRVSVIRIGREKDTHL